VIPNINGLQKQTKTILWRCRTRGFRTVAAADAAATGPSLHQALSDPVRAQIYAEMATSECPLNCSNFRAGWTLLTVMPRLPTSLDNP
jgi:hypothetical protein